VGLDGKGGSNRVASLRGMAYYSKAMRILVVEDERKTAGFLAKGLGEAGFGVEIAYDGEFEACGRD
jgi:hypothetical protein